MICTLALSDHINAIAGKPAPPDTRDAAIRLILDTLGAAAAGLTSPGATAARQSADMIFGSGAAVVAFSSSRSSLPGAVFCDTHAATALDIDDGHRGARGHPGAAVVLTALALTRMYERSASQLIAAVVAGYDVGARIASSQNVEGINTRQSGRWISFATAATASALMPLGQLETAQALAIAGVLAPNQSANGSSGYSKLTGNDVKEGIAWSSITGIAAAELARHGHSGPLDLLDHPGFYDGGRIVSGLGSQWEILRGYFKPYACCRYIHPALDRLFELLDQNSIDPADIVAIDVETFGWANRLANRIRPESLVDVQYSLPYCVAIALLDGAAALLPIRQTALDRTDLSALAQKVRIIVRPDIDQLFPAETLAQVAIHTASGTFRSITSGARGEPRHPMAFADIEEKFQVLTQDVFSRDKQRRVVDAVLALADGDTAMLLSEMTSRD